jgi:hypothetical protein
MSSDKETPGSEKKESYEVTAEGSLGLLALGAKGIQAWRKKRDEEKIKSVKKLKDE